MCLRDIAGSVPDHCNETNVTTKQSNEFSGFPMHTEIMVTLYYSTKCKCARALFIKKKVYTAIKKIRCC